MQKTINNQNWSIGKHALITGAASGIGKSIAFGLLGKCRKLTLLSRNKDSSLDDTVESLRADSNNNVFTTEISQKEMDITDYKNIKPFIESIYNNGDQIDIFINCAGGSHKYDILEKLSYKDINQIFDINAKAPIFWLKELLPKMKLNKIDSVGHKRAQIVLLSSRSAERTLAKLSIYTISKGSVEKLAESMRLEYSKNDIVFTLVNPGSIDTNFASKWEEAPKVSHTNESMEVNEASSIILEAIDKQFAINKISYESIEQWKNEPGVLK